VSWRAAEAELKLAEEGRCGAATADQERPVNTFYMSKAIDDPRENPRTVQLGN
jgi:hypothetical protein